MPAPTLITTSPTPTHTNRCRHRRTIARVSRLASQTACSAHPVPRIPATSATRVSHGERTVLIAWSTRVSATSTTVTVPVATTTVQAPTTAALSPSHHLPDAFR
jgi:hypothetical protein